MARAVNPYVWGDPWEFDPRLSRVTATLGDVPWVGRPHHGPCFLLQRLDGWWGGGAVSGGPTPFPAGDSGIHGDTFLHGRVVTLRGKVLTENGAQQLDAFDELGAIFATARRVRLEVEESERSMARYLTVAPVTLPVPQPISDRVAEVSVTVESDKFPLLDVVEQSVTIPAAGVSMKNDGTYRAYPVVSLVGPLTNPGLSWPGGSWTYNSTIPSGTTITVEMDRRWVRNLANTVHSRNVVSGSWLGLPRGATVVKRTGRGSGSIRAVWRSAWS